MAAERFLVAVGGTGQNVALALSRLVAIGAVKDNIELKAIDSDNKGELSQRLREATMLFPTRDVGGRGAKTLANENAPAHPLHNAEVTPPFDLSGIKDALFSQLFVNPNQGFPKERELFEALFETELAETRVHEGMFGRPAVGATVFANGVETKFLEKLLRPMSQAQSIMISGSFVGGTGAGTMHKLVRNLREQYAGRLFGLFFLPWFKLEAGQGAGAGITEEGLLRNAAHGLRYFYDETKELLDVSMLIGQPADRRGSRLLSERPAGRAETTSYLHIAGVWGMLQLAEVMNKEPDTKVVSLAHRTDEEGWLLDELWESGISLRRRIHAHIALQKALAFLSEEEKNIRGPYESIFTSASNVGAAFDESIKSNADKPQRKAFVGDVLSEWRNATQRLNFVVKYFQDVFGMDLIRSKGGANQLLDVAPTWESIQATWKKQGALTPQAGARRTSKAVAEHFADAILQTALGG